MFGVFVESRLGVSLKTLGVQADVEVGTDVSLMRLHTQFDAMPHN